MSFNKHLPFLVLLLTLVSSVAIAQPSNDDCSSLITLSNTTNWCSASGAYTNANATDDGFSAPTCWGTSGTINDVWFTFTATGTAVNITISGNNTGGGTLNYPQVELYVGSCTNLIPLSGTCAVAPASNSGFVSLNKSGLLIGTIYYLRVDGKTNNTGTFQLCLNNYIPSVLPGQDCSTNSFLCNKNTISQTSIVGAGSNDNEAIGSCFDMGIGFTENNSVWYTWTAANSGSLTFTIFPNIPNDDIDFIVYELIGGNCNNKQELRCEASSCPGNTGLNMSSTDVTEPPDQCGSLGYPDPNYPNSDDFLKYLSMVQGNTYALLINNFTDPQAGAANGYTLQFGGTGEFQGPTALFNTSPIIGCVGDAFIFTDQSTGGLTYNWSFGSGADIANSNIAGPHTIHYSSSGVKTIVLTITGAGGCQVVYYNNVTVNAPSVNLGNDVSVCAGNPVNIDAGAGFNSYNWSNNETTQSIAITAAGTYTVTVNDGICTATDQIQVSIGIDPTLTVSKQDATCGVNNGSATVTAQGGSGNYFYTWSTTPIQNTSTISSLPAGLYKVTVSDNGCISLDSVLVGSIGGPQLVADSTNANCGQNNGSATVTPTGGTQPYNFTWNTNPVQHTQTAGNLAAGIYSVTVADANSCSSIISVTVLNNPGFSASAIAISASCSLANGSAIVNVVGGTPPYDYSWSTTPIQNSSTAVNLIAGTYIATVSDANNCSDTAKAIIGNIPGPPIITTTQKATCNQNNGSATAIVNNGVGTYNYAWNTVPVQTNATAISLAPGIYIVDASSGNCHVKDTIQISNLGGLTSTGTVVPETCSNKDGSATIIPTGGIGNYNYYWYCTPPQNTVTAINLGTGNYVVLVRDSLCTLLDTVFVPRTSTLSGSTSTSGEHCYMRDGVAKVTMNGNTMYSYKWNTNPPQYTQQASNLAAGTYVVTVTDGACFGYFIATVPTIKGPAADFVYSPNYPTEIDPDIVFFDRSTGDPVRWIWDFGDNTYSSHDQNPAHTYPQKKGSYNVELLVQDAWGCEDTIVITIDVNEISAYYIPNAFTPDKDGLNETFGISGVGLECEPFQMVIYDRWGNLIFETKDINTWWNGRISNTGIKVPSDIYVYKIHLKPFDKGKKEIKGIVTLIR